MKAPKASAAMFEQGLAHHRAGRREQAESLYRKFLGRNPLHHQALYALSVLLFESRRFDDAARFLERAVGLAPENLVYRTNLGEAYRRAGKLEEARAAFLRTLALDEGFAEAEHNLGVTLLDGGEAVEALPHLERALELRPDDARLEVTLAGALVRLQRLEEAVVHARRALTLEPSSAGAHYNLACALADGGEKQEAISSYRRALELEPDDTKAHSSLIFVMLSAPEFGAGAHLAEATAWARKHAEALAPERRPHANDRAPGRRLRIGYVSPDLRAHPVENFLVPLLERHDRSAVELFLYGSVERPDASTERYQRLADHWRDISRLDDVRAARLVRDDRIDILVDLSLHTGGSRLLVFACKPAPIQMTWLGYAGTTGLATIDYRITDPFVDPPDSDLGVYSESSLHLPETTWCYAPLEADLPVAPLPATAAGHVTFGSQNSFHKLHRGVVSLWARVLGAVHGSRLFVYAEPSVHAPLLRMLADEGIERERVELVGRVPRREYLERYGRIDIGLDTFPFAGATTTLDAFFMGVPVVTLAGETAVSRAGACIAGNLGMPELIARTPDEFVRAATHLASDLEALGHLRAGLRARLEASPLMDAPRFARNLETAYRTAWQRFCASPI